MKPRDLALRFIKKGEDDLMAAKALLDNADIADDIIGFHCQQAVEKFLKAALIDNEIEFRKTHDLFELLALLRDHHLPAPDNPESLDPLEPYAVTARYDFFDEPISFDRMSAVETAASVRDWIRNALD